jgi:hypothetical protein
MTGWGEEQELAYGNAIRARREATATAQRVSELEAQVERLTAMLNELAAKGRAHDSMIGMLRERAGFPVVDEIPFDGYYYPLHEEDPDEEYEMGFREANADAAGYPGW